MMQTEQNQKVTVEPRDSLAAAQSHADAMRRTFKGIVSRPQAANLHPRYRQMVGFARLASARARRFETAEA